MKLHPAYRSLHYWRNWAGIGLLLWAIFLFNDTLARIPFNGLNLLLLAMSCALLWGLVTPLIRKLARTWPLDESPRFGRLAIHLLLSLIFSLLMTLVMTFVFRATSLLLLNRANPFRPAFAGMIYYFFLVKIVFYWAVVATDSALLYLRRFRAESAQATLLERQLGEARLKVLHAQLQPHFLFNTLHSLAAFIRMEDTDEALAILVDLGDLLRASLHAENSQWVPLRDEIFLVEKYLNIERRRFQDRAQIELNWDHGLGDVPVPQMLLQPLVENAIRHGLEKDANAKWVRLSIQNDGEIMKISVEDDGPGFPSNWEMSEVGTGLGHTLARLRGLYAGAVQVSVGNRETGGARIAIQLPLGKGGAV